MPNSKDPPGRLDPTGILLSMAVLGALVYGIIEGGNSNQWLRWNTLGAIVLGVVLLTLFLILERRSTHPTIDVTLFKNRHFAGGGAVIALTFFALMGSTFYLAYYLQAVKGSPLAAGVTLIAVAWRCDRRAAVLAAHRAVQHPVRRWLRPRRRGHLDAGPGRNRDRRSGSSRPLFVGAGMRHDGAATTAIMSAVPREKAGAGAAVNNTVRQVAGALGVAVLGSILAVVFRGQLGSDAPANLAAKLDQPAAVVSQLPESAQVTSLVRDDTSQSIGASLEFVQKTGAALQERGKLLEGGAAGAGGTGPNAGGTGHRAVLQDSKDSFVTAIHVTSIVAALPTCSAVASRSGPASNRDASPSGSKPVSA